MSEMENKQLEDLMRLRRALKAMSKSINKSLMMGMYDGMGDTVVQSYQRLHGKVVEMLPDDFFIDTLRLDPDPASADEQKLTQTQFMLNQLIDYVDGLIRDESPQNFDFAVDDFKNIGFELRDQILKATKNTIRSAISNLDWSIDDDGNWPDEPKSKGDADGGQRKRSIKVQVNLGDDEKPFPAPHPDDEDEPPQVL